MPRSEETIISLLSKGDLIISSILRYFRTHPRILLALKLAFISSSLSFSSLILLLLWRKITWLREPLWLQHAPLIPSPNLESYVTGTVLEYVRKGNICRTFMHPDQPDLIRFSNGIAGGIMRDFVLVKDPKIAKEILEEKNTCKPERGYRAFRRLTGYKGNYDFLSSRSHKDELYARTRGPAYETLMKRTVKCYDTLFVNTVNSMIDRITLSIQSQSQVQPQNTEFSQSFRTKSVSLQQSNRKMFGRHYSDTENLPERGEISVVDEMHHVATSLITNVAFDEHSSKFDKDLFESAVWIINDMIYRPQNNAMKLLDDLPTPRNFELKRRQKILVTTIESMIANKRRKWKEDGIQGDDVISTLLENSENSDNDLLGVLSIFFFAGFDTTSNTMAMVLYHLAQNQDVQDKCRENVAKVLEGEPKSPTLFPSKPRLSLQKLFQLEYLMAVIKEVLRLFPTVPMVTREVTEAHASGVCPRFNEQDTFGVTLNFFGLHHNPKGWTKPDEFIPERWLDPSIDSEQKVDMTERVYCPFALGKRACLGRQFAYVEMLTVISMILQRFRVLPCPGKDVVKIHEGGTLVVDPSLKLVFEKIPADQMVSKDLDDDKGKELKVFTKEEVSQHNWKDDLWLIIDKNVYDVTNYAKQTGSKRHPGGSEILVAYGGSDATAEFDFIAHSKSARSILKKYLIGKLKDEEHVLNKEDQTKHISGTDLTLLGKRVTLNVQTHKLNSPSPMRHLKVS